MIAALPDPVGDNRKKETLMTHSLSCAAVVLALAAGISAQTIGVPGVNDLVINGSGSGATSCVSTDIVAGTVMNMAVSSHPDSPLVGLIANFCAPGSLFLNPLPFVPPLYAIDVDIPSSQFAFDGTGLFLAPGPFTP